MLGNAKDTFHNNKSSQSLGVPWSGWYFPWSVFFQPALYFIQSLLVKTLDIIDSKSPSCACHISCHVSGLPLYKTADLFWLWFIYLFIYIQCCINSYLRKWFFLVFVFQSVHSNSFGNISAIYHLLVDKLENQDSKRSSGDIPLVATQRKASITTGIVLWY
jgi:hypothetical protein